MNSRKPLLNFQIGQNQGANNIAHFENLEELKKVVGNDNPNMTKDDLYDEMLKPFRYEKIIEMDPRTKKPKITYI
jgi:hypothetical protein